MPSLPSLLKHVHVPCTLQPIHEMCLVEHVVLCVVNQQPMRPASNTYKPCVFCSMWKQLHFALYAHEQCHVMIQLASEKCWKFREAREVQRRSGQCWQLREVQGNQGSSGVLQGCCRGVAGGGRHQAYGLGLTEDDDAESSGAAWGSSQGAWLSTHVWHPCH